MDQGTFDKLLERRMEKMNNVLAAKGQEYGGVDRLHNFKIAANIGNKTITPEQALWGMLRKHLVSVIDMIDDTARDIPASIPRIDDKIGDTINYMVLLEALLVERISQRQ